MALVQKMGWFFVKSNLTEIKFSFVIKLIEENCIKKLPQLTPSAIASIAALGRTTRPKQSAIGSPILELVVGFFSYNVVAIP